MDKDTVLDTVNNLEKWLTLDTKEYVIMCKNANTCFKRSGDGSARYNVMGEMIDESDEHDMKTPVANEALTDMNKLPFCVDCLDALGWAEVVYGPDARKCMQCGPVFLVV